MASTRKNKSTRKNVRWCVLGATLLHPDQGTFLRVLLFFLVLAIGFIMTKYYYINND